MNISELKVMHSAAGYYLGRGYSDPAMGMPPEATVLPYSRDSEYMSKADAEKALALHLQQQDT